MNKDNTYDELFNKCMPLIKYLKAQKIPYCTVVINENEIKVLRDEIHIPLKID